MVHLQTDWYPNGKSDVVAMRQEVEAENRRLVAGSPSQSMGGISLHSRNPSRRVGG
jgi:hypothetical protein